MVAIADATLIDRRSPGATPDAVTETRPSRNAKSAPPSVTDQGALGHPPPASTLPPKSAAPAIVIPRPDVDGLPTKRAPGDRIPLGARGEYAARCVASFATALSLESVPALTEAKVDAIQIEAFKMFEALSSREDQGVFLEDVVESFIALAGTIQARAKLGQDGYTESVAHVGRLCRFLFPQRAAVAEYVIDFIFEREGPDVIDAGKAGGEPCRWSRLTPSTRDDCTRLMRTLSLGMERDEKRAFKAQISACLKSRCELDEAFAKGGNRVQGLADRDMIRDILAFVDAL